MFCKLLLRNYIKSNSKHAHSIRSFWRNRLFSVLSVLFVTGIRNSPSPFCFSQALHIKKWNLVLETLAVTYFSSAFNNEMYYSQAWKIYIIVTFFYKKNFKGVQIHTVPSLLKVSQFPVHLALESIKREDLTVYFSLGVMGHSNPRFSPSHVAVINLVPCTAGGTAYFGIYTLKYTLSAPSISSSKLRSSSKGKGSPLRIVHGCSLHPFIRKSWSVDPVPVKKKQYIYIVYFLYYPHRLLFWQIFSACFHR